MKIQATGSSLNKQLAAKIWNELRVPTLSVHDELVAANHPNFSWNTYSGTINSQVEKARQVVPRVKFDFAPTKKWAEK